MRRRIFGVCPVLLLACGASAQEGLPVQRDFSPPTVLAHVHGMQSGGWYRGSVMITWTVIDPESLAGGCAPNTMAVDGTQTFTCTSTSEGGAASQSVTVRRDGTRPVVQLSVPAEGQKFALGESATAVFECEDERSGIASCSGPASGAPIDTSKAGEFAYTVIAVDRAGNRSSLTHTYTVVANPAAP